MRETEKAIENLNTAKLILCNPQMLTPEMCIRIGQAITDAIALLKGQEPIQCKDCAYALYKDSVVQPGHIVCTKPFTEHWQAVKPNNWFCADGERL